MITWEYNVIEKWGVPFTSQEMNQYGDNGWELVTVIEAYETVKGVLAESLKILHIQTPKEKLKVF